jgi:tRNA modification GTPase
MQTIFALSTPPGKSGIAVIRISGSLATESLKAFGADIPKVRVATLRQLHHNHQLIDKALVLYFKAPESFTGEDMVEIHCHGGRAVTKQLLDILSSLPEFRFAEPGEFTRRAYGNGKMDLTAAEGLADLIAADTEAQRKQAMHIMQDAAGFYEKMRQNVLHSLAFLEAYIDFPDEDIPAEVLKQIEEEVKAATKLIAAQLKDNQASEKIREGIYITILGAPNVGKSSLMNLLAKRDVAIVSSIAGTTRDVIEVHLDIKGYSVILADTAGIREHAEEIEREGIRRSFERAKAADIRIVVLDAEEVASGQWPVTRNIESLITDHGSQATIILINKSDLAAPEPAPINGIMPILFSAKERTGMSELMGAIEHRLMAIIPAEPSFITRSRHRVHLKAALKHLEDYLASPGRGLELKCEELRRAATEIGRITGKITADEVLGQIFSSFCIGK